MSGSYRHTFDCMDTVVCVEVVGHDATAIERHEREAAVHRAIDWFRVIEGICTRFDPASELRRVTAAVGGPVRVSTILFEAVRFAVAVAEDTDGAFDPTVGARLEARGFDRDYRTNTASPSGVEPAGATSYRDIQLDADQRTIMLCRPLVLDLGAVAKGLAIDAAARELAGFENFAIDAGGDLYLAGHNAAGTRWSVGVRHPRAESELFERLELSNVAVCTSGDYARSDAAGRHHIIDSRGGSPAGSLVSVTVVAPSAMVADALGTAAFVLGPVAGLALLERHGVDGLLVTPALERMTTHGMSRRLGAPLAESVAS